VAKVVVGALAVEEAAPGLVRLVNHFLRVLSGGALAVVQKLVLWLAIRFLVVAEPLMHTRNLTGHLLLQLLWPVDA